MNLDDLRLFCAVCSLGSFIKAANALGISKGTLSRRIAKFEEDLGFVLIIRSTRKMELTELGKVLFKRSSSLVEELEEIHQTLILEKNEPKGSVNIRLPIDFFSPRFNEVLLAFMAEYPAIDVCCNHYQEQFPHFVDQDDLCFAWYESMLPASDWIARPLMSVPQGIYAATGGVLIDKVEELANQNCIHQTWERHWLFRKYTQSRSINISGRLQLNSASMRMEAAIKGQGFCKIPCYLGDEAVQQGILSKLKLEMEPVALNVVMLYRNRNIPKKVSVFIDFFQSNISTVN